MHNFRPSLTDSLRPLWSTLVSRVFSSSLWLMLALSFIEGSTALWDSCSSLSPSIHILIPPCVTNLTDLIIFNSLISPEIWCYHLHFADKETEAQGGLATFRVTSSCWFVQVFPGFSTECPLSRETPHFQANKDSWSPSFNANARLAQMTTPCSCPYLPSIQVPNRQRLPKDRSQVLNLCYLRVSRIELDWVNICQFE